MDRRYADPLDLDQMAAQAGFSKFHFARAFKETYGESPANHLTRRRLERAKNLLRSANLTVTEVCMLAGFSSLGSFSSRFSELVGMSPSAFQRLGRAGRSAADPRLLPHGLGPARAGPRAGRLRPRAQDRRSLTGRARRTLTLGPSLTGSNDRRRTSEGHHDDQARVAHQRLRLGPGVRQGLL